MPSARACVPLVLALLGLAAVIDGLRIKYTVREPGLFDPLGPDHYVIGIGALLILLALALSVQHRTAGAGAGDPALVSGRVAGLVALCVAYPILISLAGFTVATIGFVTFAARAMGATGWWPALRIGLVCAMALFLVFDLLADIQFPQSWLAALCEGFQS